MSDYLNNLASDFAVTGEEKSHVYLAERIELAKAQAAQENKVALEVECQACHAKPGDPCVFTKFADLLGQPLKGGWTHIVRRETFKESLTGML
jgi:cytochrome c553